MMTLERIAAEMREKKDIVQIVVEHLRDKPKSCVVVDTTEQPHVGKSIAGFEHLPRQEQVSAWAKAQGFVVMPAVYVESGPHPTDIIITAHELSNEKKEAAFQRHLAAGCNGSNCNLFFNEGGGTFRHFTREEFFSSEWAPSVWINHGA